MREEAPAVETVAFGTVGVWNEEVVSAGGHLVAFVVLCARICFFSLVLTAFVPLVPPVLS